MNRVILVGRLTKDPELRRTNTDIPVVQFSLAVNRPFTGNNGEKEADFINCVVWRNQAENLVKYCSKGDRIGVDGRLQVRDYNDASGVKRYVTEVIAESIEFLQDKKQQSDPYQGQYQPQYQQQYQKQQYQGLYQSTVPQYQGGYQAPQPQYQQSNNVKDPFANMMPSPGVSDDDLPF